MDVSIENTGGLARKMTVQVPADRVDQEVASRLQSMCQTVRLDGFRPGKVPLKVIEQKYGKQVRLEVVDQVISSTLQEALTQENVRPAGVPEIEQKKAVSGETLEYCATFEIFPELSGGIQYGFKVLKPQADVEKQDIEDMLENLRSQRATWKPVAREAKDNDQVVIDFEGTIGGEVFAGNKAQKMEVVIGSKSMIADFEEQLVGVKAGDEKTLDVRFPEDYPSKEVAGKTAQFSVKVHTVAEQELPELDDEFAREFGVESGGIQSLRDEILSNMERELNGLIRSKIKNDVFTALLDKNPLEIPSSMIDAEIEELQKQKGNQSVDAAHFQDTAERRLKLGVIVSEIAKQNQIQLDPDRVRELVETIASSYEKPEEVVQWYYGNQDMLSGVQSTVIEEQVVEWVVEHSGVDVEDVKTTFDALVEEAKQSQGTP